MPREIVHWAVVDQLCDRLQNTPLKTALTTHRAAAKLGAVLHDAPYYLRGGGHRWESIAEVLHGHTGNNTYIPFQVLAAAIAQEPPTKQPLLWALFCGLVTHAATDIVFHPLVFSCTGDYYDPDSQKRVMARANHRLFEVWLDSWASHEYYRGEREGMLSLVQRLGRDGRHAVRDLLGSAWSGTALGAGDARKEDPAARWMESMYSIAAAQYLAITPWSSAFFYALNRSLGGRLAGITALCSWQREVVPSFFTSAIRYQNPVTGAPIETTMQHLLEHSVTESLRLLEPLESTSLSPLAASPLGSEYGPSLSSGATGNAPLRYLCPLDVPWLMKQAGR